MELRVCKAETFDKQLALRISGTLVSRYGLRPGAVLMSLDPNSPPTGPRPIVRSPVHDINADRALKVGRNNLYGGTYSGTPVET